MTIKSAFCLAAAEMMDSAIRSDLATLVLTVTPIALPSVLILFSTAWACSVHCASMRLISEGSTVAPPSR